MKKWKMNNHIVLNHKEYKNPLRNVVQIKIKLDSTIDNLVDSINNYMHKRRNSSTEPQSHRASEQKRNDSA